MQRADPFLSGCEPLARPTDSALDLGAWRAEIRAFFDRTSRELHRLFERPHSATEDIDVPRQEADDSLSKAADRRSPADAASVELSAASEQRLTALKRRIAEQLENRRHDE